jgi:hypothetical protein
VYGPEVGEEGPDEELVELVEPIDDEGETSI